jgi:hypothetical protein
MDGGRQQGGPSHQLFGIGEGADAALYGDQMPGEKRPGELLTVQSKKARVLQSVPSLQHLALMALDKKGTKERKMLAPRSDLVPDMIRNEISYNLPPLNEMRPRSVRYPYNRPGDRRGSPTLELTNPQDVGYDSDADFEWWTSNGPVTYQTDVNRRGHDYPREEVIFEVESTHITGGYPSLYSDGDTGVAPGLLINPVHGLLGAEQLPPDRDHTIDFYTQYPFGSLWNAPGSSRQAYDRASSGNFP